jgi:hypothetical protein
MVESAAVLIHSPSLERTCSLIEHIKNYASMLKRSLKQKLKPLARLDQWERYPGLVEPSSATQIGSREESIVGSTD